MKLFPIAPYRKWLLGIIVFTGGGLLCLSQIIHPGYLTTLCGDSDINRTCWNFWSQIMDGGFFSGFFLKAIITSSFLLLFFPERAFKWWRWFALFAIPYAIWDIATTKTDSGLFLLGSSPQLTSDIDGALFLGATILIAIATIVYNHFKLRKQK